MFTRPTVRLTFWMLVRVWEVVVVRVCGCTLRSHGLATALPRVGLQDLNTPRLRGLGGGALQLCTDEFSLTSGCHVMGAGRKGGTAVSMLEVFSCGAVGRDFRGP